MFTRQSAREVLTHESKGILVQIEGAHDQKTFLDLTSWFALNRFTGIQRVVSAALNNSDGLFFVRYSEKAERYVPVQKPGNFEFDSGLVGQLRNLVTGALLSVWSPLRTWLVRNGLKKVLTALEQTGLTLYSTWLSTARIPTQQNSQKVGLPEPTPGDRLWLLDIPKSPGHLSALRELSTTGGCSLGMLIYDLIPLERETETGEPPRTSKEASNYLEYLRLTESADKVWFLSKYTAKRFFEMAKACGFPSIASGEVVYPPISVPSRAVIDPKRVPKKLRVFLEQSSAPLVLSIGPLTPRKNLATLMRAFRKLLEMERFPARLAVVSPVQRGISPEALTLKRQLQKKFPQSVVFLGPISEELLGLLYKHARIMAVPSRLEGFGLPALEGYLAGCEVIASNSGPFPELAELINLSLAGPDDPDEWASTIQEMLSRPARGTTTALPKVFLTPTEFSRKLLTS